MVPFPAPASLILNPRILISFQSLIMESKDKTLLLRRTYKVLDCVNTSNLEAPVPDLHSESEGQNNGEEEEGRETALLFLMSLWVWAYRIC